MQYKLDKKFNMLRQVIVLTAEYTNTFLTLLVTVAGFFLDITVFQNHVL